MGIQRRIKPLLFALMSSMVAVGCDPGETEVQEQRSQIRYEVIASGGRVLIEFIDGDQEAKRTGTEELNWSREFEAVAGQRLFVSAANQDGGLVEVKILIDGNVIRSAKSGRSGFARVSMSAPEEEGG